MGSAFENSRYTVECDFVNQCGHAAGNADDLILRFVDAMVAGTRTSVRLSTIEDIDAFFVFYAFDVPLAAIRVLSGSAAGYVYMYLRPFL